MPLTDDIKIGIAIKEHTRHSLSLSVCASAPHMQPQQDITAYVFCRCLVGINPEKGSNVSKKKKTSDVNPKVLKLINAIANFEWAKPADQDSMV